MSRPKGRVVAAGDPELRALVVRTLRASGLVIMPCDTVYGILGVAPETEARIREVKGRHETKPFIRLIADPGWLAGLASAEPPRAVLELWPGPLTLVLPAPGGGTVAVRLPDDELLRSIMREVARPLYSTSVNRAGEESLRTLSDIVAAFGDRVDVIVDGGDRREAMASTILDLTGRPARVLRQGSLRIPEAILAAIERPV
jgi:L-threonylcarbamoyladenylate synthase